MSIFKKVTILFFISLVLMFYVSNFTDKVANEKIELVHKNKYIQASQELFRYLVSGDLTLLQNHAKELHYSVKKSSLNTLKKTIIYEKNILVSISTTDDPYGVRFTKVDNITNGLAGVKIEKGYMEVIDIHKLLKDNGIAEKIIFYGVDDIIAKRPILKLYAIMKKLSPPFVHFYHLPYNKLHGVMTRIQI